MNVCTYCGSFNHTRLFCPKRASETQERGDRVRREWSQRIAHDVFNAHFEPGETSGERSDAQILAALTAAALQAMNEYRGAQ